MYAKRLFFAALSFLVMLQPGLASQPAKELTPYEKETAHKLLLLQQALPQKDVIQSEVAPRLLAAASKKFRCPTREELQHGMTEAGTFEKDGIHFWNRENRKLDVDFEGVDITFSKDHIVDINCLYLTTTRPYKPLVMQVDFLKSGLDQSLITISPSEMNQRKGDWLRSNRYIEFTVVPFKGSPKK